MPEGRDPASDEIKSEVTVDVNIDGFDDLLVMEVEWRPPARRMSNRAALTRFAMAMTAATIFLGAVGVVSGNQAMVRYAESVLTWFGSILGLVYAAIFTQKERGCAPGQGTGWAE